MLRPIALSLFAALSLVRCASTPTPSTPVVDASPLDDLAADRTPPPLDASDMPGTTDPPTDGPVDVPPDAGPPPALGRRCDMTHPCPTGLLCAEGACHLDCSGSPYCGSPERCCAVGEVCSASGCVSPGMACVVSPGCGGAGLRTCPEGQYCDGTLARCLPSPATRMCTLTTTSNEFRPVEAWRWAGSSAHPAFKGVLVTPLVADVNHDGASDVLVLAYRDPSNSTGTIADEAILCALSGPGDCNGAARELWCSDPTDSAGLLNGWGNFAVADLDATDGRGELTIVTGLHRGALGAQGVAAFNERGQRVWVGHDRAGATVDAFLYGGAITVADLDGDGHGEVIVGGSVFDHTGLLRFTVAGAHAGNGGFGPIAVTADLDVPADGRLEVISGKDRKSVV